ncbi:head maturation protease, ClpP-related [Mycoplana rhizolycopersici]|uniref:ATP-dependent Clp protease proteolytic subunit n=1 Tax=Mycoplana rhizolycopersici TaxID=2746702 RepID=A0ABX2QFF2_9HYPH|nr:head maturation protease, ClpP-related [Rhizobium rhizolycopersici]NVP56081.1 Clp protease ClpP [Rhizobium rhizolycopersici]
MAVLVNGELVLYGFVGESYWGDGFTSREVIDALAEIGRDTDIVVRINSGGGYVDDGVAIFNSLVAHKGKVTVVVDAMAASSASVIAMAGDERIMRKGAMMMIHDPSSVVWGTAADMERAVKMLEKHAENLAGIYAEVTGEDLGDIRADMKAELWLTADEAVERGFATSANDDKAKAAAAHDYSIYAHAPERLVALTGRKNWSHTEARPKALASATAANRQTKREKSMPTENSQADMTSADTAKALADATAKAQADTKARIKAITTSEEATGREALASHFAYETDMTAEAAVAALKAAPQASAGNGAGESYEARRLAASALAQPGGEKTAAPSVAAKLNPTAIFNARRNATKGA